MKEIREKSKKINNYNKNVKVIKQKKKKNKENTEKKNQAKQNFLRQPSEDCLGSSSCLWLTVLYANFRTSGRYFCVSQCQELSKFVSQCPVLAGQSKALWGPPPSVSYSSPLQLPWSFSGVFQKEFWGWKQASIGLEDPLLRDFTFGHSLRGNESLLQSHISQCLPYPPPTLVPPIMTWCRYRLDTACCPFCMGSFNCSGLNGIDKKSLWWACYPPSPEEEG